jgi:hypothetical protein
MDLISVIVFLSFAVPTALFYGSIVGFGALAVRALVKGAYWRAAVFAALALAPCALFLAQHTAAVAKHARLVAAVVDARKLPPLVNPPRTLVIHGNREDVWQDQLVEMGAFDEVFVLWQGKITRIVNARGQNCEGYARSNIQQLYKARTGYLACATSANVDAAPAEGLHLYVGRESPMGQPDADWSSRLELQLIEVQSRRVVGFWGMPVTYFPMWPPLLTAAGFVTHSNKIESPTPYYGTLPFVIERSGIRAEDMKPKNLPSAEEIRANFLRLRDSTDLKDRQVAGFIATAVGATALSAEDVEPVMMKDHIYPDYPGEVGYEQFCNRTNRLCDFPDRLVATCRIKREKQPAALERCGYLTRQCNWCRDTPRCQYAITGFTAACSKRDDEMRETTLAPLRN